MPGKTLYCLGEAWLELNSTAPLASAKTFSPRMGGSAASLALAYAAQGGRASLLTQLGEDAFGHRIADALSTAGVDISRVCFTSRAPTPLLFDGGGEQLGCRTHSSELLYTPEQLSAGPQMLKCWPFPAPASWTAPAATPILPRWTPPAPPVCRSALSPLSALPSGPAKRLCRTR